MDYQVSKIVVKDNYVKLIVENDENKIEFKISVNDYLNHPYRLNEEIKQGDLDQLNHDHTYYYAYNKCLRKLGYSDCSQKEMEDVLHQIYGLTESDQNQIIQQLKSSGYLCDEMVAANQLYVDQNRLLGINKTKRTLQNRGVDPQQAAEVLAQVDGEEEKQRGLKKAEQLVKKIHGKSYRETIESVREKLMIDGFEHVGEIIDELDFEMNQQEEMHNLRIVSQKAINKYAKKYSGKQLKNTVYKYLLTKGYQSTMIEEALSNLEVFNED